MLHFPPPPATPALLPAHQGAPPHIAINRYVSAREVYRAIGPQQFEASEVDMHIVYSHIVQLSAVEETANPQLQQNGLAQQQLLLLQTNQVQQEQHPGLPPLPVEGNTWIVVWSGNPQHQRTLEMMVAVTQGRLGPHPIFVVAPPWSTLLAHEGILSQVAHELLQVVQEPDRVISIFGPKRLAQGFVDAWMRVIPQASPTGEPHQVVTHKQCTPSTLKPLEALPSGHSIRRAVQADDRQVAEMCDEFSRHSNVNNLHPDTAFLEAVSLIADGCVWLYEVPGRVVSMVAVERTTRRVASVSKMFTVRGLDRQGFGRRLLHSVCDRLLGEGKERVVVYAPEDNPAVGKILSRIGFRDVDNRSMREWVELGIAD